MTAPDLYREARRNAPRRRAVPVVGARRRVRLPSMVDTEICARLCMVICAPSAPGCGTGLLAATAGTPLFLFPNPGFGRLPLTTA